MPFKDAQLRFTGIDDFQIVFVKRGGLFRGIEFFGCFPFDGIRGRSFQLSGGLANADMPIPGVLLPDHNRHGTEHHFKVLYPTSKLGSDLLAVVVFSLQAFNLATKVSDFIN
jgi:hypothetical protein